MTYYLHLLSEQFQALNVFKYQTFRAGAAGMVAFVVCVVFGNYVIRKLISLKAGQPIRTADDVHKLSDLHGGTGGTPTMGGVLLLGAVVLCTLLFAVPTNPFIQVLLFVTVSLGALGFLDDYLKVKKRSSEGVSARVKLFGQVGVAAAAGLMLILGPETSEHVRSLHVPFLKKPLIEDMGWFALPFFAIVIVGCSNAVNLTDGLDGLATGCTITTGVTYAIFAYITGRQDWAENYLFLPHNEGVGEAAIFMMALVGAGLGFLWFNCHPAKVFMGDTGSLAIGGMLGTVAICTRQELLLVVIGGVFVMEALSVILQVASFKVRKKRIFAMAPIHHHFELKGWPESKVIVRFWILSIMCALAGLATLKLR
ncbi:MAG: phospho-N-acetylmuramoyl-pentapeptide-transferase [Verrucomicrobiota bacterium]